MDLEQLKRDLAILDGIPPWDDPSNLCRNDSYYAKSLEQKYGKKLDELRKIAGGNK